MRQRATPTRDDALHKLGRDVVGGWNLGRIQATQASTRASAYVEQASALFQRSDNHAHAARDPRQFSAYRRRNSGILPVDDLDDAPSALLVDTRRGGIGLFRGQPAKIQFHLVSASTTASATS